MNTRFLVAADLHGSGVGLTSLVDRCESGSYDALILCGDLTHFGPMSFAVMVLRDLGELVPVVFFVGGNCDPKEVNDVEAEVGLDNVHSLHRRSFTFRGLGLAGHAGSTGFGGCPGEWSEEELAEGLEAALAELPADRGNGPSPVDVLVTHAPAYDTLDLSGSGDRIGSQAVARFVEEHRPAVALSGHVHEHREVLRIGDTLHVNPGPLKMAYAAELTVEVGDGVKAEARLLD